VYRNVHARAFWPRSVAIAIVRLLTLSVRLAARRSIDGLQTVAFLCVPEVLTELCPVSASVRLSSLTDFRPWSWDVEGRLSRSVDERSYGVTSLELS
jgi:hypothetical protein